jgi:hypothetical protein
VDVTKIQLSWNRIKERLMSGRNLLLDLVVPCTLVFLIVHATFAVDAASELQS